MKWCKIKITLCDKEKKKKSERENWGWRSAIGQQCAALQDVKTELDEVLIDCTNEIKIYNAHHIQQ